MATTTVRIEVDARERLRRLEQRLGRTTAETLTLAIDALDRELSWEEVAAYYDEHPDPAAEDVAWVREVARAPG